MAPPRLRAVLSQIRRVADGRRSENLTDGELLDGFVRRRDEPAFEALVRRHGPMVRGVCGRILGRASDADDAFQATFLILVRKARTIPLRASLGGWLHVVATRVSWRAKKQTERSRVPGSLRSDAYAPDPAQEVSWKELMALLDKEIARLPDKLRQPVVRCYLEGQTQDEAAKQLGVPLRTFKRRLERARELLRTRLSRRGLTLSTALLAAGLASDPAHAVSPLLIRTTIHAAGLVAQKASIAGVVSANVAALVADISRTLFLARATTALICVVAAGVTLTGAGLLAYRLVPERSPAIVAEARDGPRPQTPVLRARTDTGEDPLPAGARKRLGTLRFRPGLAAAGPARFRDLIACPDGKTLISGGPRGAQAWDIATGKLLGEFPSPLELTQVALSPDGRELAVAQDDFVRICDVTSGKEVGQLRGGLKGVTAVTFSADGKTLALGGANRPVYLRDRSTGKAIAAIPIGLDRVDFLALTADGKTLVAHAEGTDVVILDLRSGKERWRLPRRQVCLHSLALSPDGETLAAGGTDHSFSLWNVANGQLIRRCQVDGSGVQALMFSPDGKRLASAEGGGKTLAETQSLGTPVRVWDVATGREICRLSDSEQYDCTCMAFSRDGNTLITGAYGSLRRWDLKTRKMLPLSGGNHYPVQSLVMSPDGKTLAVRILFQLRLWDAATGRDLGLVYEKPQGQWNWTVDISPDWRTLAVGGMDYTVSLFEVESRRLIRRLEPQQKPTWSRYTGANVVEEVAFSPDGKRLAAGSDDGTVRLWDVGPGTELNRFSAAPGMGYVAFSADGRVLAALTDGHSYSDKMHERARFWDVASGKELSRLSTAMSVFLDRDPPDNFINGALRLPDTHPRVVFSPDGRLLVPLGPRHSLTAWDLATGAERFRLSGHEGPVITAAFAPDGRILASSGCDCTIRFWDMTMGKEIAKRTGHRGRADCLAFSPDGKTLFSGGQDTTVLVWDVEAVMREKDLTPGSKP